MRAAPELTELPRSLERKREIDKYSDMIDNIDRVQEGL